MNIRPVVLTVVLALAGPATAWAAQCPPLLDRLDAALAREPNLPDQTMAQVHDLVAQAEEHQQAGRDDDCTAAASQALDLLSGS